MLTLFRNLKVSWKIILPYTLLVFLIVGFMLLWYVVSETQRLETEQLQKMEIVIQGLAEASSHPLAVREYNRLQELLVHLKAIDADIQYVTLVDNEGQGLASTDVALQGKTLPIERPVNVWDLPGGMTRVELAEGEADYELRCPVKLFDIVMGELRIGVSKARIRDAIGRFVVINFVIGLATVVVGVIVFHWVIRIWINRPIQELNRVSREISSGRLEARIEYSSRDELGDLARVFNAMTGQLQALYTELEQRNVYLQATVQKYVDYMTEVAEGKLSARLTLDGGVEDGGEQDDPLIALGRNLNEMTASLQDMIDQERSQREVIEVQQQAIHELSTPIIPVMDAPDGAGGIVVMPLIGSIDTVRARDITRRLLAGIREHRARVVILDITGVPIVDSGVADHLNKTIQAARLKGTRVIVTGISDAVAETIVDLGIDWSGIETLSDLQSGLVVALNRLGIKLTS